MIVADIDDFDDFSQINDKHGHHTKDQVLRAIASQIDTYVAHSFLTRVRGEEFVCVVDRASTKLGAIHIASALASLLDFKIL